MALVASVVVVYFFPQRGYDDLMNLEHIDPDLLEKLVEVFADAEDEAQLAGQGLAERTRTALTAVMLRLVPEVQADELDLFAHQVTNLHPDGDTLPSASVRANERQWVAHLARERAKLRRRELEA